MGKRQPNKIVSEGWNWVWWPLEEIKAGDCRKRIFTLGKIEAITRDNVTVTLGSTIVYQIIDLNEYFSVEPEDVEKGLDVARTEAIRSSVRDKDLEQILNLHQEIGKMVKIAIEHSDWGIDILQVMISEILPDPKMAETMALRKKEDLEKEGQQTEAQHFANLVNFFSGKEKLTDKGPAGPNLLPELAYEAALVHLGKTKQKKIASNTFGLDKNTMDALVQVVMARSGK